MWTHWFLIGSDKTFVTGDNEGYVIAWDAQSKKKLHEVTCDPCGESILSATVLIVAI